MNDRELAIRTNIRIFFIFLVFASALCFALADQYPVIVLPENVTYNTTSLPLNYSIVGEDLSAVWYEYNGTNKTVIGNTTFTALESQQSTLVLWVNDTTGNVTSTGVTFTVDTIAPSVTIYLPENKTHNTTTVDLNYTTSDYRLDTVWYEYNSTNIILTGNTTFTALDNQQSMLRVWANDTAGNVNSSSAVITVDTVPPYFTDFVDQIIYDDQNLSYDINASDAIAAVSCFTVNDTANFSIDCNGLLTNATAAAIGSYCLNITVNDTVGNENSSILFVDVLGGETVLLIVDIKSPTGNISTADTGIDINYTVSGENLDSCWWTNDSGLTNNTIVCGTNITAEIWQEGPVTVIIYANDTDGNVTSTGVTFTVDTIDPVIMSVNMTDSVVQNNTLVNVTISVNETNLKNVTVEDAVLSDGCGCFDGVCTVALNLTTGGDGYINITAYDHAGNFAYNDTLQYIIDVGAPAIEVITSPSDAVYSVEEVYRFSINATARKQDNISYAVFEFAGANHTVNGSGPSVIFNYSVSSLGGGTYEYRWLVYDDAGRVNSTDPENLTISKAGSRVNLYLDSKEENIAVNPGNTVNIMATVNINGGAVYVENINTGNLLCSGADGCSADYKIPSDASGDYKIKARWDGNENYTSDSVLRKITVVAKKKKSSSFSVVSKSIDEEDNQIQETESVPVVENISVAPAEREENESDMAVDETLENINIFLKVNDTALVNISFISAEDLYNVSVAVSLADDSWECLYDSQNIDFLESRKAAIIELELIPVLGATEGNHTVYIKISGRTSGNKHVVLSKTVNLNIVYIEEIEEAESEKTMVTPMGYSFISHARNAAYVLPLLLIIFSVVYLIRKTRRRRANSTLVLSKIKELI